jgi:hypothetical protein
MSATVVTIAKRGRKRFLAYRRLLAIVAALRLAVVAALRAAVVAVVAAASAAVIVEVVVLVVVSSWL